MSESPTGALAASSDVYFVFERSAPGAEFVSVADASFDDVLCGGQGLVLFLQPTLDMLVSLALLVEDA